MLLIMIILPAILSQTQESELVLVSSIVAMRHILPMTAVAATLTSQEVDLTSQRVDPSTQEDLDISVMVR